MANPKFKPACFFSLSEIQEPEEQTLEERVLTHLKLNYPVFHTIDNLQYNLNYFNFERIYNVIISLEKKGLIKKIMILHHIDGKFFSLNGYQFNLNKEKE